MVERKRDPRVLAYGEDALTLWALTQQTRGFLDRLGDPTPLADVTVFFRPSFGRGRRTRPGGNKLPAEFGEFDGIVASRKAIYLIEAKWNQSGELLEDPLVLRPVQRRRHEVFRAYLEAWRGRGSADEWDQFSATLEGMFGGKTWGLRAAPARSTLAFNLEFILRELADPSLPVQDVLLLLVPVGWSREVRAPEAFKLVTMEYTVVADSNFVRLS